MVDPVLESVNLPKIQFIDDSTKVSMDRKEVDDYGRHMVPKPKISLFRPSPMLNS